MSDPEERQAGRSRESSPRSPWRVEGAPAAARRRGILGWRVRGAQVQSGLQALAAHRPPVHKVTVISVARGCPSCTEYVPDLEFSPPI